MLSIQFARVAHEVREHADLVLAGVNGTPGIHRNGIMAKIRVGISGWTFPAWRGPFYPKGLVHRRELEFASHALTSIEINGTFYSLQRPATFQKWHDETPPGFVFAVKAPQYITHIRRLKEIDEPLANFFASGLLRLGDKLGPILWQFPPNVMWKDDRFEKFLRQLPRTRKEAARLAKQHGEKVNGRSFTESNGDGPVRHAFEMRHPSFFTPAFFDLLRAHGAAIVFSHASERSVFVDKPTGDFVYARLHGEGKEFKKGYPPDQVREWAKRAEGWKKDGLDTFVYFSTDQKKYSPAGAVALIDALSSADKNSDAFPTQETRRVETRSSARRSVRAGDDARPMRKQRAARRA